MEAKHRASGYGLASQISWLFCLLTFVFNVAFATQTVAVLPSDGTLSDDENDLLTDKMREAALKVLPDNFTLLKQDVVIKRLGGMENYIKECSETSCIVNLGKKAQVDYVAQCRVGKLGDNLRITVELYEVSTGGLLGMFSDISEDFYKLLPLMEKNIPDVFRKITAPSPAVSDLEKSVDVMFGYIEPEKKIDPQVATEKEGNKYFWVAVGLDVLGAGAIGFGIYQNGQIASNRKDYKGVPQGSPQGDFDSAYEKVESSRSIRNAGYIAGGILLLGGVGLHIFF
jgi:TolB-like protein